MSPQPNVYDFSFLAPCPTSGKVIYSEKDELVTKESINELDNRIKNQIGVEVIFSENIKIILTTNTALNDLYKDGLQREQFIPFISTIKKNSTQKKLSLSDDYRLQNNNNQLVRIFHPLNEKISFKVNQNFHELTKNIIGEEKIIKNKRRNFKINNYFTGITRFKFNYLFGENLERENNINIAEAFNHVFIEYIPTFNYYNSYQK